jgi:hypothetical protein
MCSYNLPPGRHTIHCNAGALPLVPGEYRVTIGVGQKGGGLSWDVLETMPGFRIDGLSNTAWLSSPSRPGVVLFDNCEWRAEGMDRNPTYDGKRQAQSPNRPEPRSRVTITSG